MKLVSSYGEMWARNAGNIKRLPEIKRRVRGVYVLYDGSMPVYVGKGDIKRRIRKHRDSKTKGQFWDHFSWYVLSDPTMMHDIEVLILRMLPPYLRSQTKQKGKFLGGNRIKELRENRIADYVSRRVSRG